MSKSKKRPPDRGGEGNGVARRQRELGLGGGGRGATGFPRVFRRHDEETWRCSFRVGGARYSGPTPYVGVEMAMAFARGALTVAEAIDADLGRSVLPRAMGGRTGTTRWQAKFTPAPTGHLDPPTARRPLVPVRQEEMDAVIAAYAHLGRSLPLFPGDDGERDRDED